MVEGVASSLFPPLGLASGKQVCLLCLSKGMGEDGGTENRKQEVSEAPSTGGPHTVPTLAS